MRYLILLGAVVWLLVIMFVLKYHLSRGERVDKKRLQHHTWLVNGALLEHENDMMPHSDPDIIAVCPVPECKNARLPKPPGGSGGGSRGRNSFQSVEADQAFVGEDAFGRQLYVSKNNVGTIDEVIKTKLEAKFLEKGLTSKYNTVYVGEGVQITPLAAPATDEDLYEAALMAFRAYGMTANEIRQTAGDPRLLQRIEEDDRRTESSILARQEQLRKIVKRRGI